MLMLALALAAGVGAVCRYVVDQVVQHRTSRDFPWGTVLVNITGSFILGLVIGFRVHHGLSSKAEIVLGTGFAGGFTTLSTWAWETLALAELGRWREAIANSVGSLCLGLLAAAAGLALALL